MTLLWKRPRQPWAAYYLDHEASYWQQVQFVQTGDQLQINRMGKLEGSLNLTDYSFTNCHQNHTQTRPMYVILDQNPFSNKKKYVDSDGWSLVWPTIAGESIADDLATEAAVPQKR